MKAKPLTSRRPPLQPCPPQARDRGTGRRLHSPGPSPVLLLSSSHKSLEMVPEKRDLSMWNKGLVNLDLKTIFTNQPRDFYMEPGTFSRLRTL